MQETIVITPAIRSDYLRYKFQAKNGFEQGLRALEIIRDQRLYLVEYASYQDFCLKEFGHTRQHMNRLIAAEHINEDVEPIGFLPLNERQARALSVLPSAEMRRDALATAYATKPTDAPLTAEWIEGTVNVMRTMGSTNGFVDTGDGEMTAATAAVTIDVAEKAARVRQHIEQNSKWEKLDTLTCNAGAVQARLMDLGLNVAEMVKVSVYVPKRSSPMGSIEPMDTDESQTPSAAPQG